MAIEGNENQMVMPVSPMVSGGNGYAMNGYPRGGYDPIAELTATMNETTDERARMEIQNCIQRIQGM